ncbi:MAG: hypothetical protein HZA78_05550 [Candidatus Schekmanbacteria bacterium]|nr:hypothetical protein [Candidatus Schekmanbacteria bacterium]
MEKENQKKRLIELGAEALADISPREIYKKELTATHARKKAFWARYED